jgi:hypothetical protein
MALLLNLARAFEIEAAAFPVSVCFWNNSGDTGRRIGMGRYADAAHGWGEGMHMGVAECVQCGSADVGEC